MHYGVTVEECQNKVRSPTHPPTHPPSYPYIHPPTHSFVQPPTHPPTQSSIHPPTHPSIHLSIHPSIRPPTHPTHLPIQCMVLERNPLCPLSPNNSVGRNGKDPALQYIQFAYDCLAKQLCHSLVVLYHTKTQVNSPTHPPTHPPTQP